MIKFFRKIRQNLLSEGKTEKYFKYAIGEIILVVIGILIALQINNWNENRINSNEEITILNSLKREFVENQILLTKEMEQHTRALRLLEELSNNISPEPDEINDTKLDSMMFGVGWLPRYSPKDGVINSIISSGKISLIKNNELSSKLSSWNSLLNEYDTTYKWTERDVFELLAYVKNKYPFKSTLKHFVNKSNENSKFQYSKKELLSDLGLESLLANRIIDANDVLDAAKDLNNFQVEVLIIIENELKK